MSVWGHMLAVDGGNTSTIAVVVDPAGAVVGAARGGCSDIYGAVSAEQAVSELVATAEAAMARAGITNDRLAAAVFSLAGADWPEDFVYLRERIGGALSLPAGAAVANDAIGALWAGTDDGIGAVAACGTYSAFAAGNGERWWHTSFFSEPAGAFHLATAALRAVCRAGLGSAPPTALREAMLAASGFSSEEALLHHFTARTRPPRADIGRLAPAVLDVAVDGDPVARGLVGDVADAIAMSIAATAARVGLHPPSPLVLTGGLFRHRSELLVDEVVARLPDVEVRVVRTEPVVGAVLMAARRIGLALSRDELAQAVEEAMPPRADATADTVGTWD